MPGKIIFHAPANGLHAEATYEDGKLLTAFLSSYPDDGNRDIIFNEPLSLELPGVFDDPSFAGKIVQIVSRAFMPLPTSPLAVRLDTKIFDLGTVGDVCQIHGP